MVKSLYGVMASFKKQSMARKRKRGESNSETASGANRLENEQNVEETYKKNWLDKYAGSWDTPCLQLWARMICSGCHDDYDTAPSLPAFSSTVPKKQKNALSEALTGAAVAFAKAVSGSPQSVSQESLTDNFIYGSRCWSVSAV